jgi:hypothetical protein
MEGGRDRDAERGCRPLDGERLSIGDLAAARLLRDADVGIEVRPDAEAALLPYTLSAALSTLAALMLAESGM